MRIFLDFEFIENGLWEPIFPLSVGMIREDGKTLYHEYAEAPLRKANEFVRTNVFPNLKSITPNHEYLMPHDAPEATPIKFQAHYTHEIKEHIIRFAGEKPEFWGYFSDYDWVCLCLTMGRMVDLPNGWPMFCLDLKQEMYMNSVTKEEIEAETEIKQPETHNSLDDAVWNKHVYEYLVTKYNIPSNDFGVSSDRS